MATDKSRTKVQRPATQQAATRESTQAQIEERAYYRYVERGRVDGSDLDDWFAALLGSECDILALDRDAALACAEIEVAARRHGRVVEHRDLLILGTAKARSLGVTTRNVAHFRGLDVPIYDPFADVHIL